jgi:hypothetical protein
VRRLNLGSYPPKSVVRVPSLEKLGVGRPVGVVAGEREVAVGVSVIGAHRDDLAVRLKRDRVRAAVTVSCGGWRPRGEDTHHQDDDENSTAARGLRALILYSPSPTLGTSPAATTSALAAKPLRNQVWRPRAVVNSITSFWGRFGGISLVLEDGGT